MMKSEKLFEPQGGPIIMSQIGNEYGPVEWEIGAPGKSYTNWFANMTVVLNTGIPWIMCKQEDTPDPIIDTCNDFNCEGFTPKKPNKPKMWTEVWTGWYTKFGGPVPYRPEEDLEFSVARFVQNNGSFFNYYMASQLLFYHGGTNFGRILQVYSLPLAMIMMLHLMNMDYKGNQSMDIYEICTKPLSSANQLWYQHIQQCGHSAKIRRLMSSGQVRGLCCISCHVFVVLCWYQLRHRYKISPSLSLGIDWEWMGS